MSTKVTGFPKPRAIIDGGFWHSYQVLLWDKVMRYQWEVMNDKIPGAPKSHAIENLRIAARAKSGTYEGMVFQDSDLAKWLEAAGNVLADGQPVNVDFSAWVEEAVDLIARAQQPDGYLNSYFTVKDPNGRWKNLREGHEMYCAGHMIEAGVSLFQGAGNRKALDIVRRLADHLDSRFGTEPPKVRGYCGHEEVELALVKLARLTGERRYLRLAQYFVDERGRSPNYFEAEASAPGFTPLFGIKSLDYYQAHVPVRQQTEAIGHAVRAMYLYTAMADLAMETGDATLVQSCDQLWESVTGRKMYITGGIGSSAHLESFSADFDLPNDTAYAETCAAIGLFLFSSRMARLHDEAKYVDVMERTLYNAVISGLALDGQSYFYVNPLEVVPAVCDANASYQHVKYRRQPWYGCACCPPNIARILSSIGEYAYHQSGDTLFADLYHEGIVTFTSAGLKVRMRQSTRYPWDGVVRFQPLDETGAEFTLALRIPSWTTGHTLELNGAMLPCSAGADGYVRVNRRWKKSDILKLALIMTVERVRADARVRADYGKVAIQRGPIVYCLEEADNGGNLSLLSLCPDVTLEAIERADLFGGVVVIRGKGVRGRETGGSGELYAFEAGRSAIEARSRQGSSSTPTTRELWFIPYYAWANRTPGEMAVWVRG